jgi:hypothetical protein
MPNKMPTDIDHRNQLVHDLIYAELVYLILKPAGQAIWTMELPLGVGIEGADDIKLEIQKQQTSSSPCIPWQRKVPYRIQY